MWQFIFQEKGLCVFLDKSPHVFLLENGVVPSETELDSIMIKVKNLEQEKVSGFYSTRLYLVLAS